MKFFWGKGKKVEEEIYKFLEIVTEAKDKAHKAFLDYLKKNDIKILKKKANEVHFFEARADDIRREVEHHLYGKALLPEFRGNILSLMEAVDKLPNKCESILYMISLQNLKIPKKYVEDFQKLIKVNTEAVDASVKLIRTLFQNPSGVQAIVDEIDKLESASDKIERKMIENLFKQKKGNKCEKLLLKELILEIGSISDYAENIGDIVTIINIKMKV